MLSHKFIFGFLALYLRRTQSLPTVQFPIDAQLPPVAIVGQSFSFTFAQTTFTSPSGLEYSVEGLPGWLHFEASDRTLTGNPTRADVGGLRFELEATDHEGKASVHVDLVVLEEIFVESDQDAFTKQLSENGNYSAPNTLLLYPQSPFNFRFSLEIFENNGGRLNYYAKFENHAPLPAWVNFDEASIRFSGTSPSLLTPQSSPQTFSFCLLASEVPNFSQSALYFQIAVTNHMLVFEDAMQSLNVSAGSAVSIPRLIDQLRYDTKPVLRDQLSMVSSNQPDWLALNSDDLSFNGVVPQGFNNTTFNLQVVDHTNDVANIFFNLYTSSSNTSKLQDTDLGTLTIIAGQWFNYTFSNVLSLSNKPDTGMEVDLGLAASWLSFDRANMSIQGLVPSTPGNDDLEVYATVTNTEGILGLYHLTLLLAKVPNRTVDGASGDGKATSQPSSTHSGSSPVEPNEYHKGSRKKALALLIAVPIVSVLFVCLAVVLLTKKLQKRRAKESMLHSPMRENVRSPSPGNLFLVPGSDTQSGPETGPRPPPLEPQLTIPWAQTRPPTRRPWPFADDGVKESSQIRSSWDDMLREVQNSYGQSSRDESKQDHRDASDLEDISRNKGSGSASSSMVGSSFSRTSRASRSHQGDADGTTMSRNVLTSIVLPKRKSRDQTQPGTGAASGASFNGRRTSGLGHGTSVRSPVLSSRQATLRQVPLSPLLETSAAVTSMRGLYLIDQPFMSSIQSTPDKKGTCSKSKGKIKTHKKTSLSSSSSRRDKTMENQVPREYHHVRKRTPSTTFSGSLWEDEECTTEDGTSKSGNWQIQDEDRSTSQITASLSREDYTIGPWEDESASHGAGTMSNAISMGSQRSDRTQSSGLRFI